MSAPNLIALKKKMEGYDESTLEHMVAYQRTEFLPAVIELAEMELSSRGYSEAAIRELQGKEQAEEKAQQKDLARGLAIAEALDEKSVGCHLCSRSISTTIAPFGLAAVISGGVELSAGSVALSMMTLPLLGAGLLMKKQLVSAQVLRLRLRLCDECARRKRWLATWNLSQEDYEKHPSWAVAQSLGFDRFVGPESLLEE